MGVDRGAAPILSVGTACSTNKIRGSNTRKMSQNKETNFVLKTPKNARNCTIFYFLFFLPEPPPPPFRHSLAPSKLNFAAPTEIRWLRLCKWKEKQMLVTRLL